MKEYPMSTPVLTAKLKELRGSLSSINDEKILVIRDFDAAWKLAARNSVTYLTDDTDCVERFKACTEFGMGDDDQVLAINKWTELQEVLSDMPHFSVAICNPPYDRNLHLKVLEQVIPLADKVINISPVRWLQDPFAPYSTRSDYHKFEETVSKKIESLDIVPAKRASEIFDAKFVMNLGIYVCSAQGGYDYHHTDPLVIKIVEKTMEHNWTPYDQKFFYETGCIQTKPFALNVCPFGGSGSTTFEIITCRSYEEQLNTELMSRESAFNGGTRGTHFEFDTEEERRNFYECYNHLFMKWTYRLWKSDVNVKAWKVPYFGDYTHPWDYKDFFAWFDLTEEEQARVMTEIAVM